MGTEQQPSRAQGTPEEIRGAEERLSGPERSFSGSRESIYENLTDKQKQLMIEPNNNITIMGNDIESRDLAGTHGAEIVESSGFTGVIRGSKVSIVHRVYIGERGKHTEVFTGRKDGATLSPKDAKLVYELWYPIAKARIVTNRKFRPEDQLKSALEKGITDDESVRKLLN